MCVRSMEERDLQELRMRIINGAVQCEQKELSIQDLLLLQAALQQMTGYQLYEMNMPLEEVKNQMLDFHLAAMSQLTMQVAQEVDGGYGS